MDWGTIVACGRVRSENKRINSSGKIQTLETSSFYTNIHNISTDLIRKIHSLQYSI